MCCVEWPLNPTHSVTLCVAHWTKTQVGGRPFAVVGQLPVSVSCVDAHFKYQLIVVRKIISRFCPIEAAVFSDFSLAVFFSYSVTKLRLHLFSSL